MAKKTMTRGRKYSTVSPWGVHQAPAVSTGSTQPLEREAGNRDATSICRKSSARNGANRVGTAGNAARASRSPALIGRLAIVRASRSPEATVCGWSARANAHHLSRACREERAASIHTRKREPRMSEERHLPQSRFGRLARLAAMGDKTGAGLLVDRSGVSAAD